MDEIVVVGQIARDLVLVVDEVPGPGGTAPVRERREMLGGKGANIAVGLAQLGVTPWLSALIVALVTMGVGYALVNTGLSNLRRTSVAPTQTIETLKETSTWKTRTPA